jgi:hypothetical protein
MLVADAREALTARTAGTPPRSTARRPSTWTRRGSSRWSSATTAATPHCPPRPRSSEFSTS